MKKYFAFVIIITALVTSSSCYAQTFGSKSGVDKSIVAKEECSLNEINIEARYGEIIINFDNSKNIPQMKLAEIREIAKDFDFQQFDVRRYSYRVNLRRADDGMSNSQKTYHASLSVNLKAFPADRAAKFVEKLVEKGFGAEMNASSKGNCN